MEKLGPMETISLNVVAFVEDNTNSKYYMACMNFSVPSCY